MMNLSGISGMLNAIASTASSLSPIANTLGISEKITDLIATGLDIGRNVLNRVEDGSIVASSESKEELADVIARLEAENQKLDDYIRNS